MQRFNMSSRCSGRYVAGAVAVQPRLAVQDAAAWANDNDVVSPKRVHGGDLSLLLALADQ